MGLGHVPRKDRYEPLKRAGFRCELCGVSADERALDVDHIHPRKHGSTDAAENFSRPSAGARAHVSPDVCGSVTEHLAAVSRLLHSNELNSGRQVMLCSGLEQLRHVESRVRRDVRSCVFS
jgi:hypothetical protein